MAMPHNRRNIHRCFHIQRVIFHHIQYPFFGSSSRLKHDPFHISSSADTLGPVEGASSSDNVKPGARGAGLGLLELSGPELLEDVESREVVHVAGAGHHAVALGANDVLLEFVDTLGAGDEEGPEEKFLG